MHLMVFFCNCIIVSPIKEVKMVILTIFIAGKKFFWGNGLNR